MKQIWKPYPAHLHEALLLLMEKFQIAFAVEGDVSSLVNVVMQSGPTCVPFLYYHFLCSCNTFRSTLGGQQGHVVHRRETRTKLPGSKDSVYSQPPVNSPSSKLSASLVPALLPVERPNEIVAREWAPQPSMTSYERIYRFSFLPMGILPFLRTH